MPRIKIADLDRACRPSPADIAQITGGRTGSVGKNESITIGAARSISVGANQSETVGGNRLMEEEGIYY